MKKKKSSDFSARDSNYRSSGGSSRRRRRANSVGRNAKLNTSSVLSSVAVAESITNASSIGALVDSFDSRLNETATGHYDGAVVTSCSTKDDASDECDGRFENATNNTPLHNTVDSVFSVPTLSSRRRGTKRYFYFQFESIMS